ncbi:hypothetical protein ACFB49_20120 [Sphingomonas sp. DBB INV C78]|uniref:hypothetical protein n=1 Tax=Sphingomonas sp. DBB INV C78 TaxID=3349434 RepID=UPI0036D37707
MAEISNVTDDGLDLVSLSVASDGKFTLDVSIWIVFISLLVCAIVIFARWYLKGSIFARGYEVDSAELGIGDSKVTFKPNMNDKNVAYRVWVELSTRKIGIPIDYDNDVIVEIYDSWHTFFSVTRELIKDIPVNKVRNKSTKQIISMSIDVLNIGLRPHLTKWQARFRRWYDYKLSTDPEARFHPQDIQKEFPGYDELVADMKLVNDKLILYRDKMNDLVYT